MNRVIFFFITACLLSCGNTTKNTITEDQAISVLKGFFTAMDIDNLGSDLVFDYTTTDFVIYEMGDKYDLESFLEIIKSHFCNIRLSIALVKAANAIALTFSPVAFMPQLVE